jgi:predicted N-acyltransferase
MALTLRVVERVRDVPEEAWTRLVTPDSSPFVEHTWLACLEEAGCVGGRTAWIPRHLVLEDGGELVAAAPAYVKLNSEGEFVFDWSWADLAERLGVAYYPKIIVAVPFTPATGTRVLVAPKRDRAATIGIFAKALRAMTGELELSSAHVLFPPEEEARAWEAAGFALRHGVQYHWQNAGFRTFEDFLATLPQKKRTQIRRERKQPAMDGVTLTTLRPEEVTREVARRMHALYLTTVDKYYYGRRYLNRRFFELVAERFAHRLAWVVAKKDGVIVASAFNVKKGDTLYGRYWGTTVDLPFLHFNVCYYHGIADAVREGLSRFNPGAGGEHKRVRGFYPTVTYSAHHLENPRLRGIVLQFLDRERRAVSRYVTEGVE